MRYTVVIAALATACAEDSASPLPPAEVHLVIDREGEVGTTGCLVGWNIVRVTLPRHSLSALTLSG